MKEEEKLFKKKKEEGSVLTDKMKKIGEALFDTYWTMNRKVGHEASGVQKSLKIQKELEVYFKAALCAKHRHNSKEFHIVYDKVGEANRRQRNYARSTKSRG